NTDYTATSTNKHKSDEQSALNRILQQTASNIIDVGALECHTLEQHEYIERVRMYNQRLNTLYTQKVVNKKALPDVNKLLVDLPSTERTLSAQPISLTDYSMMLACSQKVKKKNHENILDNPENNKESVSHPATFRVGGRASVSLLQCNFFSLYTSI
ncbi:hypothetical protein Pmani_038387, partial [Petrolisthes manimaculis]